MFPICPSALFFRRRQINGFDLDITKNFAQQPGAYRFARVNGNNRDAAVKMT